MSASKVFECENCGALGKISVKGDLISEDIAFCPVCGHEIYDEPEDHDD